MVSSNSEEMLLDERVQFYRGKRVLSGWLLIKNVPTKAECKICNKTMAAEIQVLKSNGNSKTHDIQAKSGTTTRSTLNIFFVASSSITSGTHVCQC